ncbi:MAG: alpha/beta fold hydrolase [Rhodospirillales bacterium]|nr:alpha/beta fold hydrolase [Rhodospirillales bacterium]
MQGDRKERRRRLGILALGCAVLGLMALALQLNRTQLWEEQAAYAGWHVRSHVPTGRCRLLDPGGDLRRAGWGGACAEALARVRAAQGLEPASGHLVVLLHGMGRSPWIFGRMEGALRAAGYETVALAYPSLTRDLEGHARHLEAFLGDLEDVERVSFVTHSLGGIVLREALAREAAWRDRIALGRVVMLAPPNQGSALASALDDWRLYHLIGGPSAGQLVAGSRFAAPLAEVEIGVIAGGRGSGEGGADGGQGGFNPFLAGDDDGILAVAETRLESARDFLVVPVIHTVIASAPESIQATLAFLETGRFR